MCARSRMQPLYSRAAKVFARGVNGFNFGVTAKVDVEPADRQIPPLRCG